ncbi:MAG TPA: PepSY domain-containing protein [Steroidobacteraceae bacterium]|jgi:uncharacterized membrane protein YkoI
MGLAWVTMFAVAICAQASQSAKHEAAELHRAKLSLIEAIIAAEKEGGGKAISAAFEFKRGNPAYFEVKVLSPDGGKLTRYELDPRSGKVRDTSNEALEKLVTRVTPEGLAHVSTTLIHAIALAEENSGGHAVSAEVEHESDHLAYSVETVKVNGTSQKTRIRAVDGKILSSD